MFKLPETVVAIVALVLIALAGVYGIFHFTLGGLVVAALVLVIGVVLGLGLGRNSRAANESYDDLLARIERLHALYADGDGKSERPGN